MGGPKGLDIGTNMIVMASVDDSGNPIVKMQRDAFYRIIPKSEVNRSSIKMSLEKRGVNFIVDNTDFIVVGEDALDMAIERNDVAQRPLQKGVVSPKEKDSLPMLKLIIENLIGKGNGKDKLIYSVPGKPIDSDFDIIYHTEIMGMYLSEMGYRPQPINEAFAIALSELLNIDDDDDSDQLTGMAISFGAGTSNTVVVYGGDPLIEFSLTRSGDYIDQSVGKALDISPSIVQKEKEAGVDLINPTGKIMEAVSVYYRSVISYTLKNISYELSKRYKDLPRFRKPVPIVVSGGLTMANGFERKVSEVLKSIEFPIKISDVIRAKEPMHAVAQGCYLATQL
jgi:hypothetical protein